MSKYFNPFRKLLKNIYIFNNERTLHILSVIHFSRDNWTNLFLFLNEMQCILKQNNYVLFELVKSMKKCGYFQTI